jgi:hypothetical protein
MAGLTPLSEIASIPGEQTLQKIGLKDVADAILARIGIFTYPQATELGELFICQKHYQELGTHWFDENVIIQRRRRGGIKKNMC